MTYRQLIKLIEEDGWDLVKTKGSHRQFKHPTKKGKVTIPGKLGVDVPKGILNRILKQAGIESIHIKIDIATLDKQKYFSEPVNPYDNWIRFFTLFSVGGVKPKIYL